MTSSGAPETGEASSSPGRVGSDTALLHNAPATRPTASAAPRARVDLDVPTVRLPQDGVAVEWWLTRRIVEGDGAMPYATSTVLDLWPERGGETAQWTFGLEFEFGAADAHWVAGELHAQGLAASPEPDAYHGARLPGFWSVEQDRSVTTVFDAGDGKSVLVGGEVVSPPLRDTPEAWRQVAEVLDVLRACGAEVNRSCGLHVHIGTDALLDREARSLRGAERDRALLPSLSRLAMLASVCFEDLIFRMASAEGGRHRGQAFFYRHCRPLERPLSEAYENVTALAEALGMEGASRRAALNLTNVGDPQKDTVEFRQCNGTLDGRVVQAFCRLCVALVGAARWSPAAAREAAPEPLGTHWRHDVSANTSVAAAAPLWRFLAAAFPQGLPVEAAASLLWLYRRGTWQPSLATLASA